MRLTAFQCGRIDAKQRSQAALFGLAPLRFASLDGGDPRLVPGIERGAQVAAGVGKAGHLTSPLARFVQCQTGDAAWIVVSDLQDVARAIAGE